MPIPTLVRLAIAAAGAALLAACESKGMSDPLAAAARLMFVHAIADTGAVDVRLATTLTPALTALAYGASSGYQSISSGPILLSVQPSPSSTPTSPRSLTNLSGIAAAVGSTFTFVAAGQARDTIGGNAAGITAYVDDVTPPAAGQARVRVINASPDAGGVDAYATLSGGAISGTPTFAGVDYRSASTRTLPAGTYSIRVTKLSDPTSVLGTATLTLPGGGVQTIVVRGLAGALPVGLSVARSIGVTTMVNLVP